LVIALGVLNVTAGQGTVTRNQGLQPWAERLCSRSARDVRPAAALRATREQWYGGGGKTMTFDDSMFVSGLLVVLVVLGLSRATTPVPATRPVA
jgi:hypothetical protein